MIRLADPEGFATWRARQLEHARHELQKKGRLAPRAYILCRRDIETGEHHSDPMPVLARPSSFQGNAVFSRQLSEIARAGDAVASLFLAEAWALPATLSHEEWDAAIKECGGSARHSPLRVEEITSITEEVGRIRIDSARITRCRKGKPIVAPFVPCFDFAEWPPEVEGKFMKILPPRVLH